MGKYYQKKRSIPRSCRFCRKTYLATDGKGNYCYDCKKVKRFCACGCREIVIGRLYDYVFGHKQRGSKRTKKQRKRMSLACSLRSSRSEYKKNLSLALKKSYRNGNRWVKSGKENPNWKGGRWQICAREGCPVSFYSFPYSRRVGHGRYCSIACALIADVKKRYKHINYRDVWMRSKWEVAFAKWLDSYHLKWKYEPGSFLIESKRYVPDFYLQDFDLYVEIKGWLRKESFKKLEKFVSLHKKHLCLLQETGLKALGVIS